RGPAGPPFCAMVAPAEHLDGDYAAFGRVIEGVDDAVAISRVPRSMADDKPRKPVVIQSIRVDAKGAEYPEPETL
ncbi:MAG: peptidylprolyl isomerase, partial [Dysosmobacter sp.]|nr:peptidylprolyl isomerase [Dysosmobacter sp.]